MNNFGSHPIAGIDYPETLQEFDDWFATEQACLDYLQELRWPYGFICPACNGKKAWHMKTGLFRCAACKHKTSVVAGTIFQGTRKPLRLWFQAIWYITSQKFGGSALGLKRVLGLNRLLSCSVKANLDKFQQRRICFFKAFKYLISSYLVRFCQQRNMILIHLKASDRIAV